MFTPTLRKEYESLYEQITGLKIPVKSSSLLQTYATILAIINTHAASPEDAYRIVRTMYSGYELALCSKIKPPFPSTFSEIAGQYLPARSIEKSKSTYRRVFLLKKSLLSLNT